ncbi:MAG: hypothetical protein ABJP70_02800 [Erythrobacter sp.]
MPDDLLVGSRDPVPGRGGDALRAMEWSELTARLNAAHDLRRVLRKDTKRTIQSGAASFGDAAATYFQSLENNKQPVNLVVLEAPKGSQGNMPASQDDAAKGDARITL